MILETIKTVFHVCLILFCIYNIFFNILAYHLTEYREKNKEVAAKLKEQKVYIPKIEKEAIKLTFDNVEYWELTEDGYSRYSIVDWLIEPIYKTDGYDEIVIIGRGAQKYPRKVVTGYNYKTINPYENNT